MARNTKGWDSSLMRERVEASGYRHNWIAERIGVDKGTFSRWLGGHNRPDPFAFARLAILLGCRVRDMIADSDLRVDSAD